MSAPDPLIVARARRHRIALFAGSLLTALLALTWLESRPAIVVYNDTPNTILNLVVHVGGATWVVDELVTGESRRWHPPPAATGPVSVTVDGWDESRPPVQDFDRERARILVLRLGAFQTITTSTEPSWWRKLGEW